MANNHPSPMSHVGGGFSSHLRPLPSPWQWWPFNASPLVWQAIVAVLLTSGLLLAFYQVVQGAVRHGELFRLATAAHAGETWRCNSLGQPGAGDSCLLRLNGPARRGEVRAGVTDLLAARN